jgi:signal transduction histidine kinase
VTSKRPLRRVTQGSVDQKGNPNALAKSLCELLEADNLVALQAALPAGVAALLGAERVMLVAREGKQVRVVAAHGVNPTTTPLVPERDAAALALELGEPVFFDPADRPTDIDSSLAMPLLLANGPAYAISCHRLEPFGPEAQATLDTLLTGVSHHWMRLAKMEGDTHVAALEARMRQHERKLRELTERLTRNERLKAEFVATMSHELRTPLNVVLGFTSLLADQAFGALNPEQGEACEKILESSERLAGLINDLLDVSRLEAGTLQFNFAPLDLSRLLKDAVEDMRPIANQRKLNLELEAGPGSHEIEADGERLHQVIAHLLDNALKFTEAGGTVGVRLIDPSVTGGVAIEVWDTGIGIPDNARYRLFERFYQVDSSNTRLYGGTGLGLSLVKEFIERHGGQVMLDSKVGHGSTFRLELPRQASLSVSSSILLD